MISNAKKARDEVNLKIIETKQQLQTRGKVYTVTLYEQLLMKLHTSINALLLETTAKSWMKSKNLKLTKIFLIYDKFKFSGTDNDLITITETILFSLSRFRFLLDLYNKSKYIHFLFSYTFDLIYYRPSSTLKSFFF